MVPPGNHRGKAGGLERKTNLTCPSYVWVVGGETLGHLAKCATEENGCGVFVFVWDERTPLAQKLLSPQALLR